MLEIRRGTAVKNYENTFFREFAENFEKFFEKYSIDGLLIANSECEAEKKLQIDALLITNNVVCIIDFKNFGGEIKLPRNAESENSWAVNIKDIDQTTFDLSAKNPNTPEEAPLRQPNEILKEMVELDKGSALILEAIKEMI